MKKTRQTRYIINIAYFLVFVVLFYNVFKHNKSHYDLYTACVILWILVIHFNIYFTKDRDIPYAGFALLVNRRTGMYVLLTHWLIAPSQVRLYLLYLMLLCIAAHSDCS